MVLFVFQCSSTYHNPYVIIGNLEEKRKLGNYCTNELDKLLETQVLHLMVLWQNIDKKRLLLLHTSRSMPLPF